MQSEAEKRNFGILPLIVAIVVVVVGALYVKDNAQWSMLRADAEANAASWGEFIVERVPSIENVISGKQPIEVAAAYLWGRNEFGTLKRFRVYDLKGVERIDSGQQDFRPVYDPSGLRNNAAAQRVAARRASQFEFHEEQIGGERTYYASTMILLTNGSRPVGVIEVTSDETANWTVLTSEFQRAGIQIFGLVFLSFLLPGFLYLRRNGQLKFATNRLKHTVEYDALTGTLNRAAFTGLLRDQIGSSDPQGLVVAIHFVDLDRFKNVNDTLGHAVGDQVLATTAQRLRKLLGTRERLARLGADEFAIMQPYHRATPELVAQMGRDIVREMSRPFFVDGNEIQIGATVGSATFPEDGHTVDELIRAADIALAHAKETARGGAIAFDRSMEAERQARQRIEQRLRHALSHHLFEVYYQPLYGIDGGALRGFEALLRLNDDKENPISPAVFIPIAEEVGLIGAIGHWVLLQATRTAREWPDDLTVSVNLSPLQFQTHNMPKVVRDVLEQTGLPAHRLELEVTEGVLITDTEKVLRELREIKSLGVSIALDDFGTGYSSLGYLWSFPFDKLKVDKSFMTDLAVDGSKSREILATIVALGKVLDLKITAEGVETSEQAEVLRALDCDLVQGFLYGKPLDAEHLAALLAERVQAEALERASQRLQRGVGKTAVASVLKRA
jgi:diguanylate cyclase (GGDEF)-like protein